MLIKRNYTNTITSQSLGSVWLAPVTTSTTVVYNWRDSSKISVKTPNFRKLIRTNQLLPDNQFQFHRNEFEPVEWAVDYSSQTDRFDSKFYNGAGGVQAQFSLDSPEMVALRVRAVNDCIANAKGSQWNVPVALAEGRKTAQMVLTNAQRLVRLALALKSGNIAAFLSGLAVTPHPKQAALSLRRYPKQFNLDPAKAAGSAWLEYKYGWVPFVSDVRDAVETLQDIVSTPAARVGSVRGRASMTNINVASYVNSCPMPAEWGMTDPRIDYKQTYKSEWSVRVAWKYKIRDGDIPEKLGLLNPLVVAWELVPLSFVADWFIPVGSYLNDLDTSNRFDSLGGTIGYRRYSSECSIDILKIRTPGYTVKCNPKSESAAVMVWRTPFSGTPSVEFSDLFQIRENFRVSRAKIATSVALLHQILSGFRK